MYPPILFPIPHILVLQDKSRHMDMSLSEQSDSHTGKWREPESGCQHLVSAEFPTQWHVPNSSTVLTAAQL